MKNKLISFILALCLLIAIPLEARYKYNPFTRKLDYYETGADIDLGDLADVTLTGLATGNILYYDGSAWVNLTTGANTQFLTLAAGIPAWQAIPAGVTTFVGLNDTPANYVGKAGQLVRVNAGANALEFFAGSPLGTVIIADGAGGWTKTENFRVSATGIVNPGTWQGTAIANTYIAGIDQDLLQASSPTFNDLTISTPSSIYSLSHNSFADYAANQHVALPNTIASVLSDHNLAAHTALGILSHWQDVFIVAKSGGDYTSIQTALNAQNSGGETFLIAPGTYTDSISFTADNQVVRSTGKGVNVIVTQADANIVDAEAWTNCRIQDIAIRLTAPTTAINAIQVSTGSLALIDCQGYLATAVALDQADQPSLVGFTEAGTINIKRGKYEYYHTGNAGGSGMKAAFRSNFNLAHLHLHKIDRITVTNSGTANATTIYFTSGTATTEMHNVVDTIVTDPNATYVVGMGYISGAGADNIQGNHVRVIATANTGYGLYHGGSATIRSSYNALHVEDTGGASYAFFVGASATLNSHFDDLRSDDGNSVAGTLNLVGSEVDGDMRMTDELDVGGVSEFSGDTNQYEDVFITWADAADHMVIDQDSEEGIEDQPLVLISDAREGATVDETSEATLRIEGESYGLAVIAKSYFDDDVEVKGDGTFHEDILWTWTSTGDHAEITQTNATGTDSQPLIEIDDDRTGEYADALGEATIMMNAAGAYAFYVQTGEAYFAGKLTAAGNIDGAAAASLILNDTVVQNVELFTNTGGNPEFKVYGKYGGVQAWGALQVTSAGEFRLDCYHKMVFASGGDDIYFLTYTHMNDEVRLYFGSSTDSWLMWDTNSTADDLLTLQITQTATQTAAIFVAEAGINPNGMTDHDDYESPTFVIVNKEGADTNDYAGVVIGERAQADVKVAHYFDFYAMTGAADGSVDPNATELAAIFRFGASGSTVPTYATTPGDVLFEGAIEVANVLGYDYTTDHNLFYGYLAGEDLAEGGQRNILIGESAGKDITTGDDNVIIGYLAGQLITTAQYNILIGTEAGTALPATGNTSYNVMIGHQAGYSSVQYADMNVFIGYRAGYLNEGGYDNVYIGMLAGDANISGYANVAIGNDAGSLCVGSYATFIGGYAGWKATGGDSTIIGGAAAEDLTTGAANTVVGRSALGSEDDGGFNVAMGHLAAHSQDSAWFNTIIGYTASQHNITGQNNTAVGCYAGLGNTTKSYNNNVFVGSGAAEKVETSSNNVIIGMDAAEDLTTGGGHVVIGYMAGEGWLDDETNLLVIDNSDTATPLIYGDFNADNITINGDFNVTMDAALDQIVIAQSAVAGTEDQPLIFIDDDRTGDTATELGEATIVMDSDGVYAMYFLDGNIQVGISSTLELAGHSTVFDNKDFRFGTGVDVLWTWRTDASGDDLLTLKILPPASDETTAIFIYSAAQNPVGLASHDNYVSPTFVLANSNGADANDYAGVVIGERTQANVAIAHYFDFFVMTGAIDAAADPNITEIGATFRFGDAGSAIPNHATGPGDVLFEDDIEVDGISYFGDATNYASLAVDGTLTLAGTARVSLCHQFANAALGQGGTKPDNVIVGNYRAWSYDIADDSVFTYKLPDDWAAGTDVEIHIRWAINEAYITDSGEVRWQATWSAHPADSTEAINDAGTSDDSGDINIPGTAYFLTQTLIETIPGGSLAAGDEIGITIERIALVGGNDPTADPIVTCVGIIYVADKLGL